MSPSVSPAGSDIQVANPRIAGQSALHRLDTALVEALSEGPSVSSDDMVLTELKGVSGPGAARPDPVPTSVAAVREDGGKFGAGPTEVLSDGVDLTEPTRASGPGWGSGQDTISELDAEIHGEGVDAGQGSREGGSVAAVAFAMDLETEDNLRRGLLYHEGPSPDCDDPQVWFGGIRAAVRALGDGLSTRLVIVDIDGISYPAGAIHELAEVCENGTVVIAVGADTSARLGREMLLAGVSDYLVKPITPEVVREATQRATASEQGNLASGRVAGFTGTGGSGATTLAVATALHAAKRGRYVSVLDLNRTVPATALLLDVEPAPGLDQLFDAASKTTPDPQMLDGVRAERSSRISVYAYRWGLSPYPVPTMPALNWLLGQLKRTSQLVVVDGLDNPEMRFTLLAEVDAHILVVEPTVDGAVRAVRLLGMLDKASPVLMVQNHTRAFRRDAGTRLLVGAGIDYPPDIVVPFEPSLPAISNRGWMQSGLPRRWHGPLSTLGDRILMSGHGKRPGIPDIVREG